jgi:hypothetical protein
VVLYWESQAVIARKDWWSAQATARVEPKPSSKRMGQVNELLELIQALRLMGVNGASMMYLFFERRIEPLQKRCRFGFDFLETKDPSRISTAEMPVGQVLGRVGRVLLDVNTVTYVPLLFSAKNQPKSVQNSSTRVRFVILVFYI